MSTLWTKFIPDVQIEVPMAAQPILISAIRQAAIDFCKMSQLWQETFEPQTVSIDSRDIEVEHPDDARLIKVVRARFGDTDLLMPTANELDVENPGWDNDETDTGAPAKIILLSDDIIRLIPHPSAEDDLTIKGILRPSEDSDSGPDFLYLAHYNTITMGARAGLFELINVPWSNPGRAAQLQEQFTLEARSQNIRQATGYTRSRLRSRLENR